MKNSAACKLTDRFLVRACGLRDRSRGRIGRAYDQSRDCQLRQVPDCRRREPARPFQRRPDGGPVLTARSGLNEKTRRSSLYVCNRRAKSGAGKRRARTGSQIVVIQVLYARSPIWLMAVIRSCRASVAGCPKTAHESGGGCAFIVNDAGSADQGAGQGESRASASGRCGASGRPGRRERGGGPAA